MIPNTIYLQVGEQPEGQIHIDGLNWCTDKIFDNDVEYIRAETAEAEVARLKKEVSTLERNLCNDCLEYENDGTPQTGYGWNENDVEGQVPCGCILESGSYQVLAAENKRLREALMLSRSMLKKGGCRSLNETWATLRKIEQALHKEA